MSAYGQKRTFQSGSKIGRQKHHEQRLQNLSDPLAELIRAIGKELLGANPGVASGIHRLGVSIEELRAALGSSKVALAETHLDASPVYEALRIFADEFLRIDKDCTTMCGRAYSVTPPEALLISDGTCTPHFCQNVRIIVAPGSRSSPVSGRSCAVR